MDITSHHARHASRYVDIQQDRGVLGAALGCGIDGLSKLPLQLDAHLARPLQAASRHGQIVLAQEEVVGCLLPSSHDGEGLDTRTAATTSRSRRIRSSSTDCCRDWLMSCMFSFTNVSYLHVRRDGWAGGGPGVPLEQGLDGGELGRDGNNVLQELFIRVHWA